MSEQSTNNGRWCRMIHGISLFYVDLSLRPTPYLSANKLHHLRCILILNCFYFSSLKCVDFVIPGAYIHSSKGGEGLKPPHRDSLSDGSSGAWAPLYYSKFLRNFTKFFNSHFTMFYTFLRPSDFVTQG